MARYFVCLMRKLLEAWVLAVRVRQAAPWPHLSTCPSAVDLDLGISGVRVDIQSSGTPPKAPWAEFSCSVILTSLLISRSPTL